MNQGHRDNPRKANTELSAELATRLAIAMIERQAAGAVSDDQQMADTARRARRMARLFLEDE